MPQDLSEPDTGAYLLCKRPDESKYYFIELFKDAAAVEYHSTSDEFKAMQKRIGAAKANSKHQKPKFATGMKVCTSTTRKVVAHGGAKL